MAEERIEKAAIRIGDTVYDMDRPARHITIINYLADRGLLGEQKSDEWLTMPAHDQGFVTNLGRFVDRHEALTIATHASQLIATPSPTGELFSEDVW